MNRVFIATSLDGLIADDKGSVNFLYAFPEPEGEDMGYYAFMSTIDAIVMGRKTFETVLGFGVGWPYEKPVFVWSSTLKEVPAELHGKVELVRGTPGEITDMLNRAGHADLYIDGGQTIRSFLQEDLIDEMTIATMPVVLGSGIPLFGHLSSPVTFTCVSCIRFAHGIAQCRYVRP